MPNAGSAAWLPERLLDLEIDEAAGRITPRHLTSRDSVWVERLLLEVDACSGLRRAEVEQRLRLQLRRPPSASAIAWRAMIELLLRRCGFEVRSAAPPATIRAALFVRAGAAWPAGSGPARQAIVAATGRALGIAPAAVESDLYADIAAERRLGPLPDELSTPVAIELYNLAQAQALLRRARQLEVHVRGNLKAVLRFARLQRLLCLAERDERGAHLRLSGPLSLFRHTTKYGRAMARWLPVLGRTPGWSLRAECLLGSHGRALAWEASSRDPIGTTHAPLRAFDSALERRLFRDLRRLAPGWQVEREVDPLQVGGKVACADFTLFDPRRRLRLPIEVVGFWTPQYLRQKLAVLAALPPRQPWLVCIDETLVAGRDERSSPTALPAALAGLPVFRFRRRIDAGALVAFIEQYLGTAPRPAADRGSEQCSRDRAATAGTG